MNSPVDPALLQLVQQELKSLQDAVDNMSVEFEEEKTNVQSELQNVAATLEEMTQRVKNLEYRAEVAEGRMDYFEGIFILMNISLKYCREIFMIEEFISRVLL